MGGTTRFIPNKYPRPDVETQLTEIYFGSVFRYIFFLPRIVDCTRKNDAETLSDHFYVTCLLRSIPFVAAENMPRLVRGTDYGRLKRKFNGWILQVLDITVLKMLKNVCVLLDKGPTLAKLAYIFLRYW